MNPSSPLRHSLALFLPLILLNQASLVTSGGGKLLLKCHEVKTSLEKTRSGMTLSGFPSFANEVDLEFCPMGLSCCNKEVERALGDWSKKEFVLRMQGHTQRAAGPLKLYASKLEDFVEDLFNQSQKYENEFFSKTYGIFYVKNQGIFNRFWEEIRDYYVRGRTNLVDVTYTFFSELYQKMFQAMNAQYVMDDQYMSCLADTMNAVVPFNDTPERLAMAIRHSMVAVRALSKSLKDAIEVTVELGEASEPSGSCFKALQTMHTCPACSGISPSKPCPQYCLRVMESCASRHINLQNLWDDFINSTLGLLDKIFRGYNLDSVLKHKDISISEAIMEFQFKSSFANKKVTELCGTPRLVKRSTEEMPLTSFVFDPPSEESVSPKLFHQDSRLYRIVEEVREVLKSTKGLWKSLPSKLCNELSEETSLDKCWNGNSLQDVPSEQPPANGESASSSDDDLLSKVKQETEELSIALKEESQDAVPNVFHEKKFRLQSILNQVKLATGGQDVEWFDQESDFDERVSMNTAGSGDFGGSGDIFGNGIFSSGDDLDLEDPFSSGEKGFSHEGEDGEENEDWNNWNPFSTSTTESNVEMDVDVVEASSSIRVEAASALVLEIILALLVF